VKVIENFTIQQSTYDFLLTSHSNHGLMSHHFRHRRQFLTKITKFSHPLYFAPLLKRFPLELGTSAGGSENYNDGATGRRKKFDDIFSCLDTMYHRDRRTDGHRATANNMHGVAVKTMKLNSLTSNALNIC